MTQDQLDRHANDVAADVIATLRDADGLDAPTYIRLMERLARLCLMRADIARTRGELAA